MKKSVLIILGVFLSVYLVSAMIGPYATGSIYCENMEYTANGTDCIFDDGNYCNLVDFHIGECGTEYVKEIPCAEAGEVTSPGKECCEGLSGLPVNIRYDAETDTCGVVAGPSEAFCSDDCGNGICESENWETKCTCPDDCGEPANGGIKPANGDTEPEPPTNDTTINDTTNGDTEPQDSNIKWILYVIIGIVILIILGLIIYFLIKNKSRNYQGQSSIEGKLQ